jgi:hypothetical protein
VSTASRRLHDYLETLQQRLARMHWARGVAVFIAAALAVTLLGVDLAIRVGFAAEAFIVARLVLLAAAIVCAVALVLWPLLHLRARLPAEAERRAPEFGGRLATWSQQQQRSALTELLAEDALAVAQRHPVAEQVRAAAVAVPVAIAAVCAATLLYLAIAGPGLYRYGTRELWAGWLVKGLLPVTAIDVTPGNQAVRRGGKLPVLARMRGFAPGAAQLHARLGSGEWQTVDMTRGSDGFQFTLFSLREPLSYYVSAAGVRSATYTARVVDVPNIDHLKLVYNYPAWTHLANETQDPGGDITAVAGTQVDVQVTADAPLPNAALIQDGAEHTVNVTGAQGSGQLAVNADGRYYVAARIGGEQVRLSDDYLIKVQPDAKPQVTIQRPGKDWSASSIEEVTAHVQATDDFGLTALELHYAVNGGEWHTVALPAGGRQSDADHIFALEDLRTDSDHRPIAPGDLVSYYAVARDHSQGSQTDMYFIEVRPFDRQYTQSQAAGGGGGGGGGSEQDEISQRQREILVSTWNLLRRKGGADSDPALIKDNSTLLATLQKKLAEQAQSLASRAQARELVAGDDKVARFVSAMNKAAEAMDPAAKKLASTDLSAALQPEQQALQYLLQAESQFTEMQVALQRGGGGGGGGASRSDIEQMFELEMDLKKNQYERGNNASPEAANRENDDIARQLADLARRQQKLADAAQQHTLTPEQRWQQESLRREAEDLQKRLQEMQAAQQGQGQQGQGQQGQGQSGQAQTAGSPGGGGGAGAARSLEYAIRAMSQASGAEGDTGGERARRAAADAQRQLAAANSQFAQQRAQQLQQSLADMANRAGRMYARQSADDQQLQAAVRSDARGGTAGALDGAEQSKLAADKRDLAEQMQRLDSDMASARQQYRDSSPGVAQQLERAAGAARDADLANRLNTAAQYLERGRGAYIAASESAVTDGMRGLRDDLTRAAGMAGGGSTAPARDGVGDELARVQSLRQELQRLADAQRRGAGQSPAQGQGQAKGQSQGQAAQANASGGGGGNGGGFAPRAGLARDLRGLGSNVGALAADLHARGVDPRDVQATQDLARQVSSMGVTAGGRSDEMARRLADGVSLLEQLEAQLARADRGNGRDSVRAAVTEPVRDEYKDAVAEYYRQLSRE